MVKKLICLTLSGLIAAGLAGCGGKSNKSGENITLTLSIIREDNFFHQAIKRYEDAHPNIKIQVKDNAVSFNSDERRHYDSDDEIENYRKSVNTQLMSGKASDILTVNYLPFREYANKKLLANMSEMISNDKSFDSNKYYTNILDTVKYNGSLYGMPIRFYIPLIGANKEMMDKYNIKIDEKKWTWDDFVSLGQKVVKDAQSEGQQDTYIMAGLDQSGLIQQLVGSNYSKFVDDVNKTAKFDSKEFTDILNLSKKMVDEKLINTDLSGGKAAVAAMRNNLLFMKQSIQDPNSFFMGSLYDNGTQFLKLPSGNDNSGLTGYSNRVFGISNKSKHKDEAWDFIKFLISDEAQSSSDLFGLPINKSALNTSINQVQQQISKGDAKVKVEGKSAPKVSEADIQTFEKLISQIDSFDYSDQGLQVLKIVAEEAQPFFNGQKGPEETAKLIQNKVTTYLKE